MTKDPNSEDSEERIRRYIMVKTPVEPADLAFVFGTRDGVKQFADSIAKYWRGRYFPTIVVAGGTTHGNPQPEGDVLRDELVRRGVSDTCIICERRSTNTGENVQLALPLIGQHVAIDQVRSILAIGKISSSRRYLMTLERHWPGPKKMILPINYFGIPEDKWMQQTEFRTRVLNEWRKIPRYLEMGFLKEI